MPKGKKRHGKVSDVDSQTSTIVITPAEIAAVDFNLGVPDSEDVDEEIWSEKNRWTNPEQTGMMMHMRYCRREEDGNDDTQRMSAVYVGVKDSPPDSSYPKMVGGFLDLGPNHCLDSCELVVDLELPEMQRIRRQLAFLDGAHQTQLYRWFYNHPIGKKKTSKEMTAHAWENKTTEIKEHIGQLLEHKRETIAAWKDGTLDMEALSTEEIEEVIGFLASDFEDIFEEFYKRTGWGVTLIAGGADPHTGVVRTAGYSFGCKLPNGKDFIAAFNDAAMSEYIPGTAAVSRDAQNESPDPATDAEPGMSVNVSTPVPPRPVDQNPALSAPGPQPMANPAPSLLVSTPINLEQAKSQEVLISQCPFLGARWKM
ncbi:hypothetical protein ARMSODRAFT_980417 [Armillaria solidipes]|uniref:Uncharacterized protein n=1 Tax=Armillaria solidipes TaxID=1076256 RepID=A0A2H3AVQ3_9AGAR|nr:hypothetical protein ARMSODRAFT_980417 [Armillaria solidipes]